MSSKRIGALTIGQSPRPDLVAPLESMLPDCEILQAGALDGLEPDEIPHPISAAYPLATRMRDGQEVLVDEKFLGPKLQEALNRLETCKVAATLLLCAGTFANLCGTRPLFVPFKICATFLRTLQISRIGLITPIVEQVSPLRNRWCKNGFQPTVWTADLGEQDQSFQRRLAQRVQTHHLDCIVLDYVGHPVEQVEQLRTCVEIPVIDVGQLSLVTLVSTL
jgi:protein AroM